MYYTHWGRKEIFKKQKDIHQMGTNNMFNSHFIEGKRELDLSVEIDVYDIS